MEVYDVDYNILLHLPVETVLNMCQVNKQFSAICNDEYYWEIKFKYDYINSKPNDLTWKQSYLDLSRNILQPFPVYYGINEEDIENSSMPGDYPINKLLGYVWLRITNTPKEVAEFINNLVPLKDREYGYFIHVLLNTFFQEEYIPILLENDDPIIQNYRGYKGNLWQTAIGFDIVLGKMGYIYGTFPNEFVEVTYQLPGKQPEHITY
jgi:hypothetical protein